VSRPFDRAEEVVTTPNEPALDIAVLVRHARARRAYTVANRAFVVADKSWWEARHPASKKAGERKHTDQVRHEAFATLEAAELELDAMLRCAQ
jgi:hypothetical protein